MSARGRAQWQRQVLVWIGKAETIAATTSHWEIYVVEAVSGDCAVDVQKDVATTRDRSQSASRASSSAALNAGAKSRVYALLDYLRHPPSPQ